MSTDENDIILDPFMGTGTTAIAAKRLGRHYIGFELDSEYAQITEAKLQSEQSNSKLGNSWVSYYLNEIITLRNDDWNDIEQYYIIPDKIEDIDKIEISLRHKMNISSPVKKADLLSFGAIQNRIFYNDSVGL